jgi:TRAP-type C4-dicarboxylate transport system permease small subunit
MRHALLAGVRALLAVVRVVAVVLLVCSVGLNFANIIGRYFLHESIAWAEEGMLFLMVGCVFLGSANAVWSGQHIRMDVFVRLMPEKVQEWLGLFSEGVLLVTAIALVTFAWPTIRQLQAFDQRSLAAEIPLVIPQGMIPLGLALMALLAAWRIILGMWRDEPHTPKL